MTELITVTELMRNFREYIGRVVHGGERFLLSRGGRTVAEIRGVASARTLGELPDLLEGLPHLPQDEVEALARDLEKARSDLASAPGPEDPWES